MSPSRIVVIGAANLDLISYVPRLPRPGETLHGTEFRMGFGGKGANQAVMAARLGAPVTFITKLGCDTFGDQTLENLRNNHIDTRYVYRTNEASSGVAPIAVEADGTNAIIIVTGANDLLTVDEIEAARPLISSASLMVCQLEIPMELTRAALRLARKEGIPTLLNPAPAPEELPNDVYRNTDILCPNEEETHRLTGGEATDIQQAHESAEVLRSRGAETVVLTLGARGCLVLDETGAEHIPSSSVDVVDTTGAGDAFVGAMAFHLAQGTALREAAAKATHIASISVGAHGTQTSFPYPEDLESETQ